jgi:hypothetical protein
VDLHKARRCVAQALKKAKFDMWFVVTRLVRRAAGFPLRPHPTAETCRTRVARSAPISRPWSLSTHSRVPWPRTCSSAACCCKPRTATWSLRWHRCARVHASYRSTADCTRACPVQMQFFAEMMKLQPDLARVKVCPPWHRCRGYPHSCAPRADVRHADRLHYARHQGAL